MRAAVPLACALWLLAGTPASPALGQPGEVPEARPLRYELPAAGSYDLPVIDRVGEHWLLSADGERTSLPGVSPGQCALVAFVYLNCTDATGCPLSLATLQRVDREVAGREDLADRVRLFAVSFDPARDDPKALANLRHHMRPRGDWRFLTARSEADLAPVVADYGQDRVPMQSRAGADADLFRHVAKVFLVDGAGGIRNIYSTGFLDYRLLVRDLETLLQSSPAAR